MSSVQLLIPRSGDMWFPVYRRCMQRVDRFQKYCNDTISPTAFVIIFSLTIVASNLFRECNAPHQLWVGNFNQIQPPFHLSDSPLRRSKIRVCHLQGYAHH
ncbi:hypothetical protein K437DRAFT_130394 [Tilletiaria anomala UBC 951]|uniref:Uncharacterized protein n=1 Tax=Tilletiaria anomala (strain ATCC 24038 / CBS 436.72 / UBC 951) TaxID=1037660 RepID=A0A066W0T5_TILAU|nr:uncharacterized protein K437DRAFT_130394 [Tilletiaria anomala UBC 951]KDN44684.1 hypothetical protein K437DRAFT_130394 [Tilletiaria anomala UBC 951]